MDRLATVRRIAKNNAKLAAEALAHHEAVQAEMRRASIAAMLADEAAARAERQAEIAASDARVAAILAGRGL